MRTLSYGSDLESSPIKQLIRKVILCFQYETSYTVKLDPKFLDDLHIRQDFVQRWNISLAVVWRHFRIIWKPSPFSAFIVVNKKQLSS